MSNDKVTVKMLARGLRGPELIELDLPPEQAERFGRGEAVYGRGEAYRYVGESEISDRLGARAERLRRRQEEIRAELDRLRPKVQAAFDAGLRRREAVAKRIYPYLVRRER